MSDATVEVRVLTPGQRSACSDMQKRIDRQNAEIDRLKEKLREARRERDIQVGRAMDLRSELEESIRANTIHEGTAGSWRRACEEARMEVAGLKDELAALRERTAVPVPVRWDEGWTHTENAYRDYRYEAEKAGALPMGPIQWAMNHYLAAHAVIDVPAGVPSMEELEQLVISTYCSHDGKRPSVWHRIATAIRDRILAGLAQPSSNAGQLPDDEVEALARVLHRGSEPRASWDEMSEIARDSYRAYARAAIAHMRKRPEGLPTAEMVGREMADIQQSIGSDKEYGQAILAALTPFLRDPVGKPELDVTDEQAHTESNDQFMRSMKTAQNIVAGWTLEDLTNNSIGFPSGLPLEGE